jgi:hypothetical protein
MLNAKNLYFYSLYNKESVFKKYDSIIAKNPLYAWKYAVNIRGRFKIAEKIISKDPYYCFYYAKDALNKRFELGEKTIKSSYMKKTYERHFDCKL